MDIKEMHDKIALLLSVAKDNGNPIAAERYLYSSVYDMYDLSSLDCAEAACLVIKEFAEAFDWEGVRILSRVMEMINENESAMP